MREMGSSEQWGGLHERELCLLCLPHCSESGAVPDKCLSSVNEGMHE